MSRLLVLGLMIGWACGVGDTARAADRAAALAVVERAVKAQGGAEGLARAAVAVRAGKGILALGAEVPFTSEETLNLPTQLRVKLDVSKMQMVRVLNGDKGWQQSAGGQTLELTRERLGEVQEEAYVWWLVTLVPLLKDGFDLDVLPEIKVDGRPAAGVKVSARGRPDAALYFDKDSGRLVKIRRRARETGVEVEKEYVYSDYKDVDGVKVPGKEVVTINNRKFSEVQYAEYRFLRRPDESAFTRP
jgi:hypothetical protein